MSKMIVISIDDNAKADEFLASLQHYKIVAYRVASKPGEVFHRAPVLFAYLTDANGSVDFNTAKSREYQRTKTEWTESDKEEQ